MPGQALPQPSLGFSEPGHVGLCVALVESRVDAQASQRSTVRGDGPEVLVTGDIVVEEYGRC